MERVNWVFVAVTALNAVSNPVLCIKLLNRDNC